MSPTADSTNMSRATLLNTTAVGGNKCIATTMPKFSDEQAGDNSPNSLPHRNPDDRNKTQIKMIVTPLLESEHYEEDGEYRQRLAAELPRSPPK